MPVQQRGRCRTSSGRARGSKPGPGNTGTPGRGPETQIGRDRSVPVRDSELPVSSASQPRGLSERRHGQLAWSVWFLLGFLAVILFKFDLENGGTFFARPSPAPERLLFVAGGGLFFRREGICARYPSRE
jgi:hypothetical protein